MEKQIEKRKSLPVQEDWSKLDQHMFGPADPLSKSNSRLTTAVIALGVGLTVAVIGNGFQFYEASTKPVRVLNINEAGQVETLSLRLSGFTLNRTETQAALRSAVTIWTEKFFSRIRNPLNWEVATNAYSDSFLFLSSAMADAYRRLEEQEHTISAFMSSGEPEYRVVVTNVLFRQLDKKPYEADIYFDKVYYSQPLMVSAKKSFVVNIRFTANPTDEEIEKLRKRSGLNVDEILKTNPLVLAVTQIGDPQAFAVSQPSAQ